MIQSPIHTPKKLCRSEGPQIRGILAIILGSSLFYGEPSSGWATFGFEEKNKKIFDLKGTFLGAYPVILRISKWEAHSDFLWVTSETRTRSSKLQVSHFPSNLAPLHILSLSSSSHLRLPLEISVGDQGYTVEVEIGPLVLLCFGYASLQPISFWEMPTTSMVRFFFFFFDCRANLNLWVDKWGNWGSKRGCNLLRFPQFPRKTINKYLWSTYDKPVLWNLLGIWMRRRQMWFLPWKNLLCSSKIVRKQPQMGRILERGGAGSCWELHLVFQNVSGELKEVMMPLKWPAFLPY